MGAFLAGAAGLGSVGAATAQEAPKPPEVVADEYLRGIEALAWRATAQRVHPEALDDLRALIRILLESDRSGEIRDALSPGRPAQEFLALPGERLFMAVMETLERRSPGIVNAMSARSTDVIGPVAEGDTLRHVVYRLQWELSGSSPEVKVLTLKPDARGRWRVLRANELEVIRPALRGLRAPVPPPGTPPPPDTGAGTGPSRP